LTRLGTLARAVVVSFAVTLVKFNLRAHKQGAPDMNLKTASLALLFTLAANAALAEDKPEGFLCCNMRTDGAWISDISYTDNGTKVLPLGTPTKVTGYGR